MTPFYETKLGKLYCGDSLEILPSLNIQADLLVTDPPYRTTSRGNAGNAGGMLCKELNKSGKVFQHNDIKIKDWLPLCINLMNKDKHIYIMCNHTNLHNYLNVAEENKLSFIKSIIWNKGNKIMGQFYMSQFEYILFFRYGAGIKINNCGTPDILDIPNKKTKGEDGKNLHDTEKPVKLMQILIENSTNEGDTILEPFAGIGSTIIASELSNRKWVGIEKDEIYCKTIIKQMEQAKREKRIYNE